MSRDFIITDDIGKDIKILKREAMEKTGSTILRVFLDLIGSV